MKTLHKNLLCSVIAALCSAGAASAQDVEFDVYLARPENGSQTVFGGINVDEQIVFPGQRVFESEFFDDAQNAGVFLSDEPGFNNPGADPSMPGPQALGATAPNPGDVVSVNQLPSFEFDGETGPLFFWDGASPIEFSVATGVTFTIGDPEENVADGIGAFDDHPALLLVGDNQTEPTEGVYLASFTASLTGLEPTEPLFLVFSTPNAPAGALEDAVGAVNASLVPEPATAALLVVAFAGAAAQRRRNA